MSARILLVEDNPITRKLVRLALESGGYEVHEASDGAAGLDVFARQSPALVLLDLNLPDVDSFALLAQLRSVPGGSERPILALSGMLSAADSARLASAGFDDVVSKPVEGTRLLLSVRAHLPAETMPVRSREQRRILIADDDPVQRKLVAIRLTRAGYLVDAAADGEQALELARKVRPDAIVSDVLMPRLDGFGLCVAVRNDPALAQTPILLVSNSYLEAQDRELARKAGADDLVVRTPELREVFAALESASIVSRMQGNAQSAPPVIDGELERARIVRMMNQLERQVAMQASLNQRYSLLSAELSVLSGISEALTGRDDIEEALRQVLTSCFDAGGIAVGMVYRRTAAGLQLTSFGTGHGWEAGAAESFFGQRELLQALIDAQACVVFPSTAPHASAADAVLARSGAGSLIVAPLGYRGEPLGALVMMSYSRDLHAPDRVAFAQAVAGQISVALALAKSFEAKDASEREARATATVLRSILESMADGVIVSNEHGAITHVNPAAARMRRVVDHPGFPLARALRGEAIDRMELYVKDEVAGTGQWLSVNARRVADERHQPRGAVAVFRDVTAEKAAQAQLLVNDRMVALGTLAAGVGHEINNPLMAVLGNLEMAVDDLELIIAANPQIDFGELPAELRDAHDAAGRVRNIVRDLKLFSRSDSNDRKPIAVEDVLESSIRIVRNEIRHRAELVRDFRPVPMVLASEARLGQVFLNLIVNALQAIPEGRANENQVRIATRVAPDGRVRVEISDTGSGMTPEVLERIFTPFYTTKPVGVGTGLGLAICHNLITSAGGEITVDSMVDLGTTFCVLLPPTSATAEVGRRDAISARLRIPRRGRILVLDDDVIVGITLRRALGVEHDVVAMVDARATLALLRDGARFDVILCDIMMPTATGMEIHAAISELDPAQAARIVFITGGAFTPQAQAFLAQIPNSQLEKPIDLGSLRALITRRLDEAGPKEDS